MLGIASEETGLRHAAASQSEHGERKIDAGELKWRLPPAESLEQRAGAASDIEHRRVVGEGGNSRHGMFDTSIDVALPACVVGRGEAIVLGTNRVTDRPRARVGMHGW